MSKNLREKQIVECCDMILRELNSRLEVLLRVRSLVIVINEQFRKFRSAHSKEEKDSMKVSMSDSLERIYCALPKTNESE